MLDAELNDNRTGRTNQDSLRRNVGIRTARFRDFGYRPNREFLIRSCRRTGWPGCALVPWYRGTKGPTCHDIEGPIHRGRSKPIRQGIEAYRSKGIKLSIDPGKSIPTFRSIELPSDRVTDEPRFQGVRYTKASIRIGNLEHWYQGVWAQGSNDSGFRRNSDTA